MKNGFLKKILVIVLSAVLVSGMGIVTSAAEKAPFTTYAFAETENGWLMGCQQGTTYIFRGIQYGAADRFMPAQKPAPWEGVKGALAYGTTSPNGSSSNTSVSVSTFVNPMGEDMVQNEDCLYLNVWTQTLDKEAKKPVIFFLHGGGLSAGASNELHLYDGKNISEYGDVVYVNLNHRLNILGYFELSAYGDEYKYSGNNGLMDTVLALEWVRDNIANFGGDPDNVTIVGQSGGGSKVAALMGTPAAKGLFQRAVQVSGGATGTGTPIEDRQAATATLFENIKANTGMTTDEEVLQFLSTCNLDTLYETIAAAGGYSYDHTIDGDYYPERNYDPATGTWCELAKDIPLIVSSTFGEMGVKDGKLVLNMAINGAGASFNPADPDAFLADAFKPNMTEDYMVQRVMDGYEGAQEQILELFHKGFPCRDTIDVLSLNDRTSSIVECQDKAKQGGAPVYNTIVAYELPLMGGNLMSHTTDLIFWFHNMMLDPYLVEGDLEGAGYVQDCMASALVNFARTGDPSSDLVAWAPFTDETGETMVFDTESQVINYPDFELLALIKENSPASSGSASAGNEAAEEAEEAPEGESPEGESPEGESPAEEAPAQG